MSGIIDIDSGEKIGNAIDLSDGKEPINKRMLFLIAGIGIALVCIIVGGILVIVGSGDDTRNPEMYDIDIKYEIIGHTIGNNITMRMVELTHMGGEPVDNISTLRILPYAPEYLKEKLPDRIFPVCDESLKYFREDGKIFLYFGTDGKFHISANLPWEDEFVDLPSGDYEVHVEDARCNLHINTYAFTINESHTYLIFNNDMTISSTIRRADAYESILVYGKEYKERLQIDKPIRLFATDNAIINGGNIGAVVLVQSHDVSIYGFDIRNSGYGGFIDGGIVLQPPARNVYIVDNEIHRCSNGIWVWQSNGNVIHDNYIHTNDENGIWVQDGEGNDIRKNVVFKNNYGLVLEIGEYNYIVDNTFMDNKVYGIYIPDWRNLDNICEYNNHGNDKHEFGKIIMRD